MRHTGSHESLCLHTGRARSRVTAALLGKGIDMAELPDVRFLTVAEVAELMRVSKMTVYRLVHSGELPAVRFGRSYRVPESAVTEALQRPIADVG